MFDAREKRITAIAHTARVCVAALKGMTQPDGSRDEMNTMRPEPARINTGTLKAISDRYPRSPPIWRPEKSGKRTFLAFSFLSLRTSLTIAATIFTSQKKPKPIKFHLTNGKLTTLNPLHTWATAKSAQVMANT